MLGLGVFIGIAKKAYTQFDSLFGALKSRSTYYENDGKSRSDVSRISSADILDKATILLTPTATSDARVHSVKTYTGDELVTNGGFDSSASWGMQSSWSIASGSANYDGISSHYIEQSNVFSANTSYKITFTISNNTDGIISIRDGAASTFVPNTNYSNGTYTFYITSSTNTTLRIYGVSGSGSLSIDNVSVTEADADFDFDRASSATRINSSGLVQDMQSITDPELVLNGDFEELGSELVTNGDFATDSDWSKSTGWSIADGVASFNTTTNGSITQSGYANSKTYKVSIDVVSYVRGNPFVAIGQGSQYTIPNSIGTHIIYVTSGSVDTILRIYSGQFGVGGEGSIDNVSVQQVDPNDRWTVANSDSNNYVEFTEGFARLKFLNTSPITTLNSTLTLEQDKTYELVVDVHDVTSGAIKIDAAGLSELFNAEGVTTRYLKPTSNTTLSFYRATADVDITLASVSVKDITFSTDVDLARINYDSNGANGHILLEPTSTNLQDHSEAFDNWTHAGGSFTLTNELAPDGKTKVYKSTANSSSASAHFYTGPPVLVVGQKYTASYFFKYVDHPWVRITHISSSSTGVWFNIQNGTIGTESGTSVGKIEDYGNGWYRCSNTFTATQTSSSTNVFGAVSVNDGQTNGLENKSVLVWGAQVENLEYPTSYIPVHSTSNVTREVEKLTGSGNAGLIESRQGTFYVDIAALAPSTGAQISISLSGGSSNDRVLIYSGSGGGEWKAQFKKDSSSYVSISKSATISNQAKIAAAWASGRYVMFVDGVKATAYSTGSETESTTFDGGDLTSIQFSPNNGSGSNFFYGKCKALAVFNEALSDTELTNLTS